MKSQFENKYYYITAPAWDQINIYYAHYHPNNEKKIPKYGLGVYRTKKAAVEMVKRIKKLVREYEKD